MKTLIVKLGALGDVVRTTVLLNVLPGEVYWLTNKSAIPLLKSRKIKEIFAFDQPDSLDKIKDIFFDKIISLDEEKEVLNFVNSLKCGSLTGIYIGNDGSIDYTAESAYWFDMSLSSKLGKLKADELKKANSKAVPQILVEMMGHRWAGQEYDLGVQPKNVKGVVGLIDVTTSLWPNKYWERYGELDAKLRADGIQTLRLGLRETLDEHINDINNCEVVVCGDTLGLHLALALKKKVVSLFNCTPPQEIFSYGRLIKIISPLYDKYFYKKQFSKEATSAIGLDEVYTAVKKLLNIMGDRIYD